jgi:radical SAM superfamily enzyme with C-terminal helix-hairpin-helix motif
MERLSISINSKGKKYSSLTPPAIAAIPVSMDELEELHQKYKDLVVLGFPANDFKEQEKGMMHRSLNSVK